MRSGGPAWPHLEDLNLEKFEGSDEKIATWLFWHLRLLKDLRLDRGHLGLFCFDLREQQFGTLRTLRLGWLRDFTSQMALGSYHPGLV